MTAHAYKIGQAVRIVASSIFTGGSETYKIVALMPEERGDWQYRVQSTSSLQQRVIWERQIVGTGAPAGAALWR